MELALDMSRELGTGSFSLISILPWLQHFLYYYFYKISLSHLATNSKKSYFFFKEKEDLYFSPELDRRRRIERKKDQISIVGKYLLRD